ncbi:PCC domain-containing protein [Arthrobacter roseus]|uniref:PCC domain-containing protein n=1 Tax=Arthrobacter roseus TaxID=136274 RepID=UPI001965B114|nr:PPC domain-containing DNA-binding protein [Arthrobacter roseus]MBM7847836.1 putative DNA-binding protein with PD1-like motif [Arthrobacter roseus]
MSSDMAGPTCRTVVARVLPNEDITDAVLRICSDNGFSTAIVRGGTGSLIGALFEPNSGGPPQKVDGPATEVVTLVGHLESNQRGRPVVHLSCTLVDKHGNVHAGRLVKGANPVSVTFELVVQEVNPVPFINESHDRAASTDALRLKEK